MVILDRLATEFAVFIELRKEIGFFSNFRVILSDDFDNLTRERRVEFLRDIENVKIQAAPYVRPSCRCHFLK